MSPSGPIMSYIFPMQEKPALRPSVAVGEALRGVARDILAEARAAIEDPAKSDADAVHDFRRAMKRWRALLRLVEPFLGEEARRLRDEARDLAHALTGARNAQSALDALADLEKHGLTLSARSTAGLRQRIEAIRQAAETTLNADMRLPRPSAHRGRALAASSPDLRRRRRSAHPLLSRRAADDPGALARYRRGRVARVAQARRDPPLSDRHHRAVVAALRQNVERRGAAPA